MCISAEVAGIRNRTGRCTAFSVFALDQIETPQSHAWACTYKRARVCVRVRARARGCPTDIRPIIPIAKHSLLPSDNPTNQPPTHTVCQPPQVSFVYHLHQFVFEGVSTLLMLLAYVALILGLEVLTYYYIYLPSSASICNYLFW